MVYGLLWIIYTTGQKFYFYASLFVLVLALVMVVVGPLIMQLFNKFDPIEDNQLKTDIERLAAYLKYPLSKIEVINGSKRNNHSNAFFYGIGSFKRIVLYDTLLK